jgi:hypothetical protein
VAGDESAVDLAPHLDALVIAVGRVEALAAVVQEWFDGASWHDAGPRQTERLAYMIGAISEAAAASVGTVNRFRAWFADQQPAEAGDDWER